MKAAASIEEAERDAADKWQTQPDPEKRTLMPHQRAAIEAWIAQGKMMPVDPKYLFFTIWAATQTYADFDTQICAVLGVQAIDAQQMHKATVHLTELLLCGCGIAH